MTIKNYFLMWAEVPAFGSSAKQAAGTTKQKQAILFLGVLVGAALKVVYDVLSDGHVFGWKPFALAAIGAIVTFPAMFYGAGMQRARLTFAKWCVALQYGFFWSIVLDAASKKLGG